MSERGMVELKHVYFQYGAAAAQAASTQDAAAQAASTQDAAAQAASAADQSRAGELQDITLTIQKGELVLISGPSGCGKTTLLRLINGLIPRFYQGRVRGEIRINGTSFQHGELYELARVVGTVFQNPKSQFYTVDTTSELSFACENQGLPENDIYQRIDAAVADLHVESLMDRNIFHLSDGEKQQIACASIEVAGMPIILLDEPSANLDYDATIMLKKLILHWKRAGKTVVVAEHRIVYLWDVMDRLIVMEHGTIVNEITRNQKDALLNTDLQKMGLRTRVMESPMEIALPSVLPDDQVIKVNNFAFAYRGTTQPIVTIDSLDIAQGEITAIVGKNGAGKTSFLHCFCGLEQRCTGTVVYESRVENNRARRKLCFMVMQNTANQLFTESVLDEVLISLPKHTQHKENAAMDVLRALDLEALAQRHPQSLSGGQKQRLAIACAVASERKILLLDEPTSGLDYAHMNEMAHVLTSIKAMGITIIVVTHDAEFIHACCTRLLCICGVSARSLCSREDARPFAYKKS